MPVVVTRINYKIELLIEYSSPRRFSFSTVFLLAVFRWIILDSLSIWVIGNYLHLNRITRLTINVPCVTRKDAFLRFFFFFFSYVAFLGKNISINARTRRKKMFRPSRVKRGYKAITKRFSATVSQRYL